MMTTTTRLEALALTRAAVHSDIPTADLIWAGTEDRGALVGALATLCANLFRAHFGDDIEDTLDRMVVTELADAEVAP